MITKITILNPPALSWEVNPNKSSEDILEQAGKEFSVSAEFLSKASLLMSYLKNYPESIENAIKAHFGPDSYAINIKTKKRRIYHVIGGLYIHEEDK